MATIKEQDIVLHTKDANGNPVIQLPVTRLENVEGQDTKLVHTTGNETIAGKKTFSDSPKVERVNPYVDMVQTDITKGTAPTATSYAGLRFGGSEGADADDKQMGALLHNYYANGANIMRLQVTKPEVGSTETASVAVAFGADGVPYATAPTPANAGDKSTKVATTEWVQDRLGADLKKYLPLAGGTMTGRITFDSDDVGSVFSDGKDLCLGRGDEGALLRLRGHDTEDNAGGFHIRAKDAEGNYWYLIGYADGRLTWGSYDIINAYGGTMQGKLKFLDDGAVWSDGSDLLVGDASGALLRLRNLENPELPGVFQIRASDGADKNVYLIGNPDGGLTWNGKDVTLEGDCLPLAGGTMAGAINFKNNTQQKISVDTSGDLLLGDSDVGCLLRVRGNASDSNPGGFQFRAQDSSASQYLIGKPDGTLTWGGKNVVRSVNGTAADAAGNVAISIPAAKKFVGPTTVSSASYTATNDGFLIGVRSNTADAVTMKGYSNGILVAYSYDHHASAPWVIVPYKAGDAVSITVSSSTNVKYYKMELT